jgi:DNA modification methylase
MSGSGSTGVIAALLGRDAVCVELEEKFHKWQLQAKEKVYGSPMLTRKGSLSCIKGDARNLSELLQAADAIVTSPPYAQSASGNDRKEFWERLAKDPTSCRYGRELHPHTAEAYGLTKDNIGNLPMGEISAVITSHPYSETFSKHAGGSMGVAFKKNACLGVSLHETKQYSDNEGNIGNLSHGDIDTVITSPDGELNNDPSNIGKLSQLGDIDAIITSPPYEAAISGNKEGPCAGANEEIYGRWKEGTAQKNSYIQHGEPCKVDAVITSSPYDEGAGHGGGKDLHLQDEKKLYLHSAGSYSISKDNIGEMRKETYLQAMLTVYSEMFKVLKTNGTAAIVVKPFIRNRTVIDLPYQTWLLMQKCGFQLTRLFKLRLEQQSFWRILYMKKNPEVPQIWHEYVLVCAKPLDGQKVFSL